MVFLALSATFVGFIHSLSPGHWVPVVLIAKARNWTLKQVAIGATLAASGHILLSLAFGLIAHWVGMKVLQGRLESFEDYAGWFLLGFGLLYSGYALLSHRSCKGHEHHGPRINKKVMPYLFLFSIGFSPCVAALPLFALADGFGGLGLPVTMLLFSFGVLSALVGGSLLVCSGLLKLDHPLFEHYGEVLTGVAVSGVGIWLLLHPHSHI